MKYINCVIFFGLQICSCRLTVSLRGHSSDVRSNGRGGWTNVWTTSDRGGKGWHKLGVHKRKIFGVSKTSPHPVHECRIVLRVNVRNGKICCISDVYTGYELDGWGGVFKTAKVGQSWKGGSKKSAFGRTSLMDDPKIQVAGVEPWAKSYIFLNKIKQRYWTQILKN